MRVIIIVAAVVVVIVGCPMSLPPPPGETARRSLTTTVVDDVVLPAVADFAAASVVLAAETELLTQSPTDDAARSTAQRAWRTAMATWQQLEMLHVGPSGSPATVTAGQGLRDRIYAWPQTNLCAVDVQLIRDEFGDSGWVATRLPNVVGLAALEYVLFSESGNACPIDATINTDGSWDALASNGLAVRRARFAAVIAADIADNAAALQTAWLGDTGFASSLRTAGEPGSLFGTAQQAVDDIYGALFAVELFTKDKKLAIPSGLHIDCPTAACPERAESRFSETSKDHVLQNLQTTQRIFVGSSTSASGFDDLLIAAGATELATAMTNNLAAAVAATTAFEGTFEDALATEPARVHAVYDAVKAFTDDFKTTFPSTLGLRVPAEGAGDND